MEFGGAKRKGDALKTSFGVAMEATNEGGSFYGELGFLLRNNVVLKLYLSLNGYCKRFHRIRLFPGVLPVLYLLTLVSPKEQFKVS